MGGLVQRNKDVARRKGMAAAVTAASGLVLSMAATPVLGIPIMAVGAWLGWDWFMFRARHGMRF